MLLLLFSLSSYGSGTLEMILWQLFSKSLEHSHSARKTSDPTFSTFSSLSGSTTPAQTVSVTGTGLAVAAGRAWLGPTEGPILLCFLQGQWEGSYYLFLSLNCACGWPNSQDDVAWWHDGPQTRWLDTCCFHLHLLLWWCPSSMPSGHQLITHSANYILLLAWQDQRRMIIVNSEERLFFF